jgi:hypothetical protein
MIHDLSTCTISTNTILHQNPHYYEIQLYTIEFRSSGGFWCKIVLVEIVQVGDFDAKSYKLNFLRASWKCVQVEFVLVETVLVGDPL